ncbi:Ger(x)C family spore germination protein [Robertmurraya korlensis]|uniref:Ger(x)C family spore germination protein n=1 Tax=Robertmurraya korlensis TaxID=519977 RepID=UPI00203BD711|nr:Ger(x)C family spore germination protein [Robertmurraya korlensis]MCM3603264.1 Ger(x)C family spore germination protein [Robertmurraya korlensis]
MKRYLKWSLLLIIILLLTGCAGKRELNDLALVMAVGIDKGEEENSFKVTAQIARPADARGQTGAPSGQTGEPILTIVGQGESLFDAIRDLSSFTTRNVFWAHNQVIVINEDLAKDGIAQVIDFFTRNPELRMRTWVVITPEKASTLVSTVTGLELIPGEAVNKLFRYGEISNVAPNTQIMDVQAAYLSQSSQPIIARVTLKEVMVSNKKPEKGPTIKQVDLAGAGVFQEDRLVGILKPEETRALMLFTERLQSGVVTTPCTSKPERTISVELRDQMFQVTPHFKGSQISFTAEFDSLAVVVEAGCPFSIDDQEQVTEVEKAVEKKLKKEIETTVNKVQKEYKTDVLELGKVFHNDYPGYWKQVADDWEEVFPTVDIKVSVNVEIKDSVLLWEETNSGKKENSAN